MEGALRGGLEQSLQGRATTVAAALEEQNLPLCSAPPCTADDTVRGTTIYAAPLAVEPSLDGVRDDWNSGDAAIEIGDGGSPVRRRLRPVRVSVRHGRGSRPRVSTLAGPEAVWRSGRARARADAGHVALAAAEHLGTRRVSRAGDEPRPVRAHRGLRRARDRCVAGDRDGLRARGASAAEPRRRGARRRHHRRRSQRRRLHRCARRDLGRDERRAGTIHLSAARAESPARPVRPRRRPVSDPRCRRLGAVGGRQRGAARDGARHDDARGRPVPLAAAPRRPAVLGRVAAGARGRPRVARSARRQRRDGVVRQRTGPRGDCRCRRADHGRGARRAAPCCSSKPAIRS